MITLQPTTNLMPESAEDSSDGRRIVGRALGDVGPDFGPDLDDGGWFWGDSIVTMADGPRKQVKYLRKGDTVVSDGNTNTATVACVLVMPVEGGRVHVANWLDNKRTRVMTRVPILFHDKVEKRKHGDCQFVYNVYLDQSGDDSRQ